MDRNKIPPFFSTLNVDCFSALNYNFLELHVIFNIWLAEIVRKNEIIQDDPKVSVPVITAIQKSDTQRHFDHPV